MDFYSPVNYTINVEKEKSRIIISFSGLMEEGHYLFIDELIDDLDTVLPNGPGSLVLIFDLDNIRSVGDAMWTMGARMLNWYMKRSSLSIEDTAGHIFAFSKNMEIHNKWRVVFKNLIPEFETLETIEELRGKKGAGE